MRWRWIILLWLITAVYLLWWMGHNPLPDGYQNEYLLVGNAMDLWGALVAGDLWHIRWFMYTGYWPWGLYAVPWPWMAVTGPTHAALVAGNLVHLGVLLVAVNRMGRSLGAPLAPVLILLCPGVFGSLVRFEPNLAAIAWTAAGLACLVQSVNLTRRWAVVGWGVSLGIGLLMDRLTVAFFLVPAVLPLLLRATRAAWVNLALGIGVAGALAGAYYREFFLRHTGELLSQAPVGEIDSAGVLTATTGPLEWVYYPLALVDSQAGPLLGFLMLWGLLAAVRGPSRVLTASVLGGGLFFTLVAKNQVFYTLPILGPLAVLAATRGRWSWLGVAGGVWSLASVGVGVVPGGPWLPETWVSPRHILARPPTRQTFPLEAAMDALGESPGLVSVLSQDHTLFEGFVVLAVREAHPDAQVRGVVLDPHGTFEEFHEADAFLWVGPPGQEWPTAVDIIAELEDDHYVVDTVPPAPRVVASQVASFEETGRWPIDERVDLVAFQRR